MALWNLGSINVDVIYSVPHIPAPGETLASTSRSVLLGGKGANMSVAAARAGCAVHHIGAVGRDGGWTVERLAKYGVQTDLIRETESDTAQAIIAVSKDGENSIILHPGANADIPLDLIEAAVAQATAGDWFVTQNETNMQPEALARAKAKKLDVAYAAAPFSARAVIEVLPFLDLLILNEVEAAQLQQALGRAPSELDIRDVVVTLGKDGADWFGPNGVQRIPAIKVDPVDSTGAGDTFTGYLLAGLAQGQGMEAALATASAAGALMVTRFGTADVIPTMAEVAEFILRNR